MTSRSKGGLAACLLAATLLVAWKAGWLPGGAGPGTASTPAPASESKQVTAAVSSSPRVRDQDLPPETLPLSERLPALRAAALSGNAEASCRLVVEQLRCARLEGRKPGSGPSAHEANLAGQGRLDEANLEAQRQILSIDQASQCEDAALHPDFDALDWLAKAAAQGHGASAVLYFRMGEEFRHTRGIYRQQGFDAWRRDAPRFLAQAFRAGVPEANAALAQAYRSDSNFAEGIVANDMERAYLHARLDFMLRDERWQKMRNGRYRLDEATRDRLAGQARQLHTDVFGGRRFKLRGLVPYQFMFEPETTASDFCGGPHSR